MSGGTRGGGGWDRPPAQASAVPSLFASFIRGYLGGDDPHTSITTPCLHPQEQVGKRQSFRMCSGASIRFLWCRESGASRLMVALFDPIGKIAVHLWQSTGGQRLVGSSSKKALN